MRKQKIIALLLTLVFALGLVGCIFENRDSQVLKTLGNYEFCRFWTRGEFQDYTDFGIYHYVYANLENNPYFRRVSAEDIETIHGYLDNYEQWIETFRNNDPDDELVQNYHFDRNILDAQDYFYIYTDNSEHPYWNYDFWVFDSQTKVLYYFHTNI